MSKLGHYYKQYLAIPVRSELFNPIVSVGGFNDPSYAASYKHFIPLVVTATGDKRLSAVQDIYCRLMIALSKKTMTPYGAQLLYSSIPNDDKKFVWGGWFASHEDFFETTEDSFQRGYSLKNFVRDKSLVELNMCLMIVSNFLSGGLPHFYEKVKVMVGDKEPLQDFLMWTADASGKFKYYLGTQQANYRKLILDISVNILEYNPDLNPLAESGIDFSDRYTITASVHQLGLEDVFKIYRGIQVLSGYEIHDYNMSV